MENTIAAGFGKAEIVLPATIFPIEAFSDVYTPIFTRIAIIKNAETQVFVSLEFTSLQDYVIDEIKDLIKKEITTDSERIWVNVTHTFSVPHVRSQKALCSAEDPVITKNELLCKAIYTSVANALQTAIQALEEAKIGFGHGYCGVNVNRDIETSEGWWLGANDMGASDKCVPVIKFVNSSGKLLGLIYSYDVQSSIMADVNTEDKSQLICGDLIGTASSYVEEQYDNLTCLFLLGSAGDQAPLFKANHTLVDRNGHMKETSIGNDGFVLVNALGKKLGDAVVSAAEKITTFSAELNIQHTETSVLLPGQKIPNDMRALKPTRSYQFEPSTDVLLTFSTLIIGDIAIIGLQPELSSSTGISIKKNSPYPMTIVTTMVNGGAKYLVDQSGYDRLTYEAMNSMFAAGSAEQLAKQVNQHLLELAKQRR